MADAKINPLVTEFRTHLTTAYNAINAARSITEEVAAAGYAIEQSDLVGVNESITPAEVLSAFSTFDAIDGLLDAGHRTNLSRLVLRP
jgi:hypothetical protein